MAEKGGKGSALPRGKGVSKSPAGKADSVKDISGGSSKASRKGSSANSKAPKKLETDGKSPFVSPSGKGDWGKGGDTDKAGKDGERGKSPIAKYYLPKNVKILKDCEAATILEGIQDHLLILSDDPKIKIPESFGKALKYTQNLAQRYTNPQDVAQALEYPSEKNPAPSQSQIILKQAIPIDLELHLLAQICMISNAGPETIDEVYALVPSLKGQEHGAHWEALAELAKLKQPKRGCS
ncbi:unnamed protein product [Spirodela intermedia]|uniref:Uncharacterized protein n=1 Tax=Spirodela intermedia TaxID=51605 RepID=A0A7I8JSM0_SPIIN|nr:unnamed protein product [Spirodela intermedia]CAA6672422.1 unnamed protein product [Spirodela intermedia]